MAHDFRIKSRGNGDLKTRYRPQTLNEVVPTVTTTRLKKILTDPNASQVFLFEGLTGAGKTTCARILARASVCSSDEDKPCLECDNCRQLETCGDFYEVNIADQRGIDDMRALIDGMRAFPFYLTRKIYVLDEVHQLSPHAQQILLKALEEPPEGVIIFLCTTEPEKLKRMLVARTQSIKFKSLSTSQGIRLIDQVLEDERREATEEVKEELVIRANGSVRDLLNVIQAYLEGDFASGSETDDYPTGVKDLASALMIKDWRAVSRILKDPDIKKAPEAARIGVCCILRGSILWNSSVTEATPAAFALGHLIDELTGMPHLQYNQLVLKCLRSCYKTSSK